MKYKLDWRDGKFLVGGTEKDIWIVGGAGDVLMKGNKCLISNAALKELFAMWIKRSHV